MQHRMAIGLYNAFKISYTASENLSLLLYAIDLISLFLLVNFIDFLASISNDIYYNIPYKCHNFPCISTVITYAAVHTCMFFSVMPNYLNLPTSYKYISNENTNKIYFTYLLGMMYYERYYQLLHIQCGDIELNPGPEPRNQLSICHLNIRSLSVHKLDAIKHQLSKQFDVITLSETFLSDKSIHNLHLDGFQPIIRKDRDTNGGGVAIYVSEHLVVKRIENLEVPNVECLWTEIHATNNKLLIGTCYRPPNADNEFWDNLQHVIENAVQLNYKNILIAGDLNSDFSTPQGTKLSNFAHANGLTIHIQDPTRITENTATILDQFISNCPEHVQNTEIYAPLSTNDHCTIGITIKFNVMKGHSYFRHVWLYDRADFEGMNTAIQEYDWNLCFQSDDIDEITCRFNTSFLNIARKYIPNKLVQIRTKDAPWFTTELRKLKRNKDKMHKIAKRSQKAQDWANFRSARNTYTNRLRETVESHKQKLAEKLKNTKKTNPKGWWQTAKQFLGRIKSSNVPPMIKDGISVFNTDDKTNCFNEAFIQFSNIDTTNAKLPNFEYKTNGRLSNIETDVSSVTALLKDLNISKASGPDSISARMLKETASTIAVPLTRLINMSLSMGKVPLLWKQANVIPIFKSGNKSDFGNYRPVSLLNIVSKICEKAVFKHVFNFIRDYTILTIHQSGFVPNDSTVHQLVYLYDTFCKALNDRKDVRIVFCDQSKAFDRVWHDGLLFKLQSIGIDGTLLQWFESYLKDRQQRTVLEGKFSQWLNISAGVPQGSVLGPLLFLVYINDITENVRSPIKLFADDTSLYITFDDIEEATYQLNQDIETVKLWADQWLVSFNPHKTKPLLVTLKRNIATPPLFFNGQILQEVSSHKHLGLVINSKLTWKDHLNAVAEKAHTKLNVLSQLGHTLDRTTLLTMYTSFIRPSLEYGNIVWCNCTDEELFVIEALQRRAARIITGAIVRTNTKCLYQEIGFETIRERQDKNILKFFHKIVVGESPSYLVDLLPDIPDNRYNLRRTNDFPNVKCRISKYQKSFIPRAISTWNRLPDSIKNINDTKQFKDELNKNINKDNPLYSIGNRKENIIMARLRLNCSNLKGHLYNLKVIDSPECQCGYENEDSFHYFFICNVYQRPRADFHNSIINHASFTLRNVLFGDENLPYNENVDIINATMKFIKDSKRFS